MAVLMLLCSIRILWVHCALIFLTDSFPKAIFDFTCFVYIWYIILFIVLHAFIACKAAALIYMPLQQLPHDCMCHIYYS